MTIENVEMVAKSERNVERVLKEIENLHICMSDIFLRQVSDNRTDIVLSKYGITRTEMKQLCNIQECFFISREDDKIIVEFAIEY